MVFTRVECEVVAVCDNAEVTAMGTATTAVLPQRRLDGRKEIAKTCSTWPVTATRLQFA